MVLGNGEKQKKTKIKKAIFLISLLLCGTCTVLSYLNINPAHTVQHST